MKEPNSIDEMFKDVFDNFSVLPEESVKFAIDKHLFAKKNKRRFVLWLFGASTAFGLTAGIYYFATPTPTVKSIVNIGMHNIASNKADTKNSTTSRSKLNINASVSTKETEAKRTPFSSNQLQKRKNGSVLKSSSASTNINQTRMDASHSRPVENQLLISAFKPKKIEFLNDDSVFMYNVPRNSDDSSLIAITGSIPVKNFRQSLSAFVNYGFESTTSRNTPHDYNDFETATIKITGIEARIEYKQSISKAFELNVGLGYVNYSILQKGNLTIWEIDDSNGAGISTSDTLQPIYLPTYYSDQLRYRFQQFQVGIGVSYKRSIFQNWNLDLSLGSNFSIGQVRKLGGSSLFETPSVSKVGVSVYFRPAIEYRFGRYGLLAFGHVNQPILSQIKWSFLSNRNPNFGGGIACRYYF